jgi:hypothetical protein
MSGGVFFQSPWGGGGADVGQQGRVGDDQHGSLGQVHLNPDRSRDPVPIEEDVARSGEMEYEFAEERQDYLASLGGRGSMEIPMHPPACCCV